MIVIILTWDNLQDIDIVRNENGDPMVFPSFRDADEWLEEGWALLCRNSKVVQLEADMNPYK